MDIYLVLFPNAHSVFLWFVLQVSFWHENVKKTLVANVKNTLRLICKLKKNLHRVFFGFGNYVLVYFRPQERFVGEYFWPGSQPAPMMRLPGCRRSISKPFPIRRRPEIRFNARHQGTCEKSMYKLPPEHFQVITGVI